MSELVTVLLENGWNLDEIKNEIREFRGALADMDCLSDVEELFMDMFGLEPDYLIELL